jgi:Kdo2-lipid IVA lauroyltransferase/acyltransferase
VKKRIWQWVVRSTFGSLLVVLRFIPWKLALAWGTAMGCLGYCLSSRYRKVADKNLRLAYGDSMTEGERRALTLRVFQHFSRMALVECLKAATLKPDEVRKLVAADSYDYVDELLSRGKGMILITAHFGNWELLARRAALEGYHFVVVARQSPDAGFNALTDRLREGAGYTVHPRGASPRPILQTLRSGGIVAILPDQKSEDVFVPFFGEVTGTVAGPAVLALKTGAPILPMFCPKQPDGTYRMILKPEIDIHSTGDSEADSARIMRDINLVIEDMVREYPDQWLWLHDRWKIRPVASNNNENAVTSAH